ncbi:MAG TPA: hypothetical protein HA362_01215 [Nanoarchaeota archaeon]|nr:hypothetical protein [Nanoarchaeota archaeon]
MENMHTIKMAMVASATKALEFKRKNPGKSDDEAIRYVLKVSDDMLTEIGA